MATAVVRVAGSAVQATVHRKVTLRGNGRSITLPITNPEVQHTNRADDWTKIERPGERPLIRRKALRVPQETLQVIFVNGGRSVEAMLETVELMAAGPDTIAVAYGALEAGNWRITDLKWTSKYRAEGSNKMTRAEATITLWSDHGDGYKRPAAVKKPAPARSSSGGASSKASHPKTYVVRRGDTLSAIAARLLGHADLWPRIAKANRISDPRTLQAGRRLVIL